MTYQITDTCALVGDIHGYFSPFIDGLDEIKNLVFLGDIGFGFMNVRRFLIQLDAQIPKGINCYFLRGNHDNPAYWVEDKAKEINEKVSRFHMIPDGTILEIHGKKYLCIGGGISVDRHQRTEDVSYWKGEEITEPNVDEEIYGILSHTGFTPPIMTHKHFFMVQYEDVAEDCQKEQDALERLYRKYKPKVWYNGHFHIHTTFQHEKCDVVALESDEIYPLLEQK